MRRRILIVLEAGTALPSGFIRGLIYRDALAQAGYQATFVVRRMPWLRRLLADPPRWLRPFFALGVRALLRVLEMAAARVNEIRIVRRARSHDVIYLSKVTSPRLFQALRRRTTARLVLDFGDALWLPGRSAPGFDRILQQVDAVTTDNEVTAEYIRRFQPSCTVVPDCPQVEWFDRGRPPRAGSGGEAVVIGWVGTPGTTYNLFTAWEALERLFASRDDVSLRLLGAEPRLLPPFEYVRYSLKQSYTQQEMIEEVRKMDIGLFPLQDVEACRVRGVLKATVYMSGGVPVIASPVGQVPELIEHGTNGFLAVSTEQWTDALDRLIADPSLRRTVADNGLALVRRDFTVDRAFAILRRVLDPADEQGCH